jgi:Ricin-type beta-trefoil lectin domain
MSVYQTNPNDGDQHFDWSNVPGGQSIKHRATGKCLNAARKYAGAEVNVWSCNNADPDQIWQMQDKGNGYVLWRLKDTNLCLTADTPVQNESRVALQNCAYGVPNGTQDWIGSNNPNSPVYGGQTRTEIQNLNYRYQVYLAAIRPTLNRYDNSGETGHAWLGLVKFFSQDRVTYLGNTEVSRLRIADGLREINSISAPGPNSPNYYLANDAAEIRNTNLLLIAPANRFLVPGTTIGYDTKPGGNWFGSKTRTISFVRADISYAKYMKYLPQVKGGQGSVNNCTSYFLFSGYLNSTTCNCSSLALRIYGDSVEIPTGIVGIDQTYSYAISPLGLAKDIDRYNGYSDWNIDF